MMEANYSGRFYEDEGRSTKWGGSKIRNQGN